MKAAVAYSLVVLLAAPAYAAPPTQDSAEMWRAFARQLTLGAPIKVRTTDGKTIEAQLVYVTADAVRVSPKTRVPVPVREIPFSSIDRIEKRHEGWSPGAKVLAGVGIAGSVALIAFIAALSHID
jgi:hypothetical protein